MRVQEKISPRISGGTSVDMFNSEFRARFSSIASPLLSSICLSKTLIDSMLISRPILSAMLGQYHSTLRVRVHRLTSMEMHDFGLRSLVVCHAEPVRGEMVASWKILSDSELLSPPRASRRDARDCQRTVSPGAHLITSTLPSSQRDRIIAHTPPSNSEDGRSS
jgi:hypothetical protein